MDPLKRIVELLEDESPRKRIAAAVVLGELKVKEPAVVARLVAMAGDPLEAYAEAAIEALGQLGSLKALPVLLTALGRPGEVGKLAAVAIAALGEEAVPGLRAQLETATPEARAALSQLLPHLGGREGFELALEGLRGQSFEANSKVALSLRQEARTASEAERKALRTQVERFLEKKKTLDDEPALRGALKMLGFLEQAEAEETLLKFTAQRFAPLVRLEAVTALRFASSHGPSKKAVRALMQLLEGGEALVARAARDTLTVLPIGASFAEELAQLCGSPDADVALWAIGRLGTLATSGKGSEAKLAARTLLPVARSGERARAEAAARVLQALEGGPSLLVEALCDAQDEVGAHVLAEVLDPLAKALPKKDLKALLAAGAASLAKHLAVARRQLEPVRNADPEAWAEALRAGAKALAKKDPARAEAISQLLGRSTAATVEDRFGFVVQQLMHASLDPHPRARQRDPSLQELERLQAEGFKVAQAVGKEKKLTDEARYYVGVHFAEKPGFELKNVGAEVLEGLAGKGRGKLATAAKNKLKLLEL